MFISFGLCCFYTIQSINEYLEYNTVTDTKIFYENPAEFPTVTFCNLQGLVKNYTLEETLLLCVYNRELCNASIFYTYFDVNYGSCFRFNGGLNSSGSSMPILFSRKPGKRNCLRIDLFIGTNFDSEDSTGLNIRIHNKSLEPSINEGVDIAPGFRTNLVLNRIFDEKLPFPYNNCVKDFSVLDLSKLELVREILSSNKKYRQIDCFELCFYQKVLKSCNCSANLINVNNVCNNPNQDKSIRDCFNEQDKAFYQNDVYTKCHEKCPSECDTIYFDITTSISEFPGEKRANTLLNNSLIRKKFINASVNYNLLKSSVLSFRVYYADLSYTLISQSPQVLMASLISNIGGILGLFLGISFLTTIEIFEFLFEIVMINFGKNKMIEPSVYDAYKA